MTARSSIARRGAVANRAQRPPAPAVRDRLVAALRFVGELVAVAARGLVPGNWRRTMRAELAFYLYQVGVRAVPVVTIAGLLVGVGLVFQILYWLRFAGQEDRIGEFVVLVLVQQLAPVGTVLIIIGRSGSVLVEEVGQMTRSGYARAMASHGVDPLEFVMIPRAFAVAVSAFLLTMVFLHAALWSGYFAAWATDLTRYAPDQFITAVLGIMGPGDYFLLVAKPLLTGFVVGYLSIWFGSRVEQGPHGIRRALPKAFAASLIATIAIGAALTVLV